MRSKKTMDFTDGPILKNLIIFTLPIIATNLLQQFYNTADQMVVGTFSGELALAAVGATSHVTNLILNLITGLTTGATVTCAKYFGAKDKERLQKTIQTSITLALISGLFMAVLGILISKSVLALLGTPKDVLPHAVKYMSIIFAGTPFMLIFNFGASVLRAGGDTKRPFLILSLSGCVNVLLNLLFVIKYEMAEGGVALATIISQFVSAVLVLYILIKRDDELKFYPKKMRIFKNEFLNIVKIGLPTGLNAALYNIANITLQSTVNTYGKEYMAASTAASSTSHYVSIMQSSLQTATVSFVGQNYGAKKYDRIHKTAKNAMLASFTMTCLISFMISAFPQFFLGLFSRNPEVIRLGVGKLIILSLGYIVFVPSSICGTSLRGMEKSKTPMMINIVSICISRIGWIWLANNFTPASFSTLERFNFLFFCYPISWFLSSAAMYIVYRKTIKNKMKNQ